MQTNELITINFSSNNTDIPKTFWKSANDSFVDDQISKTNYILKKVFETTFTAASALNLFLKIYEVL